MKRLFAAAFLHEHAGLLTIIYLCIISLSVMYVTQPIQPLFAKEFSVSLSQASLLTSVVLLPLAIAPIFYGYLLEKIDPRRLLLLALWIVGSIQILLIFPKNFYLFMALRLLQALCIPALLTTILTLLTRRGERYNMQRQVSIYVAASIVGGMLGRLFSGFMASAFSWQIGFVILGLACFLAMLPVYYMPQGERVSVVKIKAIDVWQHISDKRYLILLLMVFIMFFSFQAILNFLPFRAQELNPNIRESSLGILYTGYLIGIVVSLLAQNISIILGGKIRAITFGLFFFAASILLTLLPRFAFLFCAVFFICAGMFIAHSILTNLVNSINPGKKGISSGLYLAFYYAGGCIGSVAPGYLYHHYGWMVFVCCVVGLLAGSTLLFFHHRQLLQTST